MDIQTHVDVCFTTLVPQSAADLAEQAQNFAGKDAEELKAAAREVRKGALLNQAACFLKLGANRDVITAANKVDINRLFLYIIQQSFLQNQAACFLKLRANRDSITAANKVRLVFVHSTTEGLQQDPGDLDELKGRAA